MSSFDQAIAHHPAYSVGFERHAHAVEAIKRNGGVVYMPGLSNIQSLAIGKNAKIHTHVWIGKEVSIGDDVLIQAFAFIPDKVYIRNRVFIGPRVTFCNDKKPPSNEWSPTFVEDGVSIGAGAVILPGVTLGKGCVVGAGAIVTKSIPPGETWVGNPARPI